MARDKVSVQYPEMEDSQSVSAAKVTKTAVTAANGIELVNAFANKNNTLIICVENTAKTDSALTFIAGDAYPNAMLGDLEIDVLSESLNAFQVQDMSRFENKDGSIYIDFDSTFTGNIFAIAKSADLNV